MDVLEMSLVLEIKLPQNVFFQSYFNEFTTILRYVILCIFFYILLHNISEHKQIN